MADCDAALRALCTPEREVSAHYLIRRNGDLIALVDEDMRAWHAGTGTWRGQADINSRSIGIELDNDGFSPFSNPLMTKLESLLPKILARWNIPPEGVIGHSCMAPERKIDPGPRFDWLRLARQGLAIWPQTTGADVDPERFRADALAFGYPQASDDLLLQAVRLRFRPWGRGALDANDCGLMADLADRYGDAPGKVPRRRFPLWLRKPEAK